VTVATFTDAGGARPLIDYTATITWGDGTPADSGTIALSGSTFTVTATHVFATPGRFTPGVNLQEVGGGSTTVSTTATVGGLKERFVAQAFLDLLHRPVDSATLSVVSMQLGQGVSAAQVALEIENSNEYRSIVLQGLYTQFLHRNADPGGL